MSTGTNKLIGFLMATQRPLDEHYLNEGVAWATVAEALAGIPSGSRSPYKLVNIAGVLYWFKSNLTELEAVTAASMQTAAEVAIEDIQELFEAEDVETALAEVKSQANATDTAVSAMTGLAPEIYMIKLPAAASVESRIAAAVETTDYPTGWVLADNDVVDLLITHTLNNRKVAGVNVWEVDGENERLLVPFSSAYSGCLVNGLTLLIEGLAPKNIALRIEIFVNL